MSSYLDFKPVVQGHWWIEHVSVFRRRPGFIEFYIQTEQKRPEYQGGHVSGDSAGVMIGSRAEGSLRFREGEDGSESTFVDVKLPRTLPWRTWEYMFSEDKWGIHGVAWTRHKESWERHSA